MSRKIIAVIPAAGVGSRMKADKPKQYLTVLGKTILEHTLNIMLTHRSIDRIIVALGKNDPYFAELHFLSHEKIQLVEGGETRANSVLNALNVIEEKNAWALVHDAARPCLTEADLNKLLEIHDENGAILAIPVTDTIKRSDKNGTIITTEDRSQLWQAQTPQFFRIDLLQNALENGLKQKKSITDEASAMELAGFRPHLVVGRSDNIKVTRPEDLTLAEFYLTRKKR
ncbi:2-C-methyl-D-erythritol 4-phosphate cytidylyltransferase [Rodentibacter rarus]|uniref:2-C-methyl-D-erythritol 4-phosphate cytidylyltransferase n=1 Tax=Rodentibacter rarus TaxID=1908260 RepID=A0A1V3IHF4_9PAST|nr:2-C-methyl-D-erythritol 4-phosphate cytidylyltransferase [Rodentibacter rarus]OOF40625.1 2-C-methyl-D-erythritol 4-phosphate cytidylyltransferase [Rodentibacter rarus]OOF43412.1 2-C-methyl-D-erythritol 4-phosphate cytidylyltransferase [Rodentibacter rarus]